MEMVAMDWKAEMFKMLAVFEHQAVQSLANIKLVFKRNGFALDPTFKQYFLHASNTRLVEAYNRFEIASQVEDTIFNQYDANVFEAAYSEEVNEQPENKESIQKIVLVEIDDTTDEEGTNEISCHATNTLFQLGRGPNATAYIPGGQAIQQKGNGKAIRNCTETRIDSTIIKRRCTEPEINSIDDVSDHDPVISQTNQLGTMNNSRSNLVIDRNALKASNVVVPNNEELMTKKFKCVNCEYSSNQKRYFDRHMRTHTGVKPYRCDRCPKKFTNNRSLKRHKATHINEFPFHCRCCFSGFSQKDQKEYHEMRCKSRRYECHICKKFVTLIKTNLKLHMRTHNGEKPFRCEICMKRFTAKCSLKTHLDTIHARINH